MKLKVLSFNIHKGFGYFNKSYSLTTIREILEMWNPDIIMLQELHGIHPKTNNAEQSPLETLADNHWPFHQHGVNSVYSNNFHGNAIISRFPIQHWENIDISTNPFEKRGLLKTSIKLPTGIEIDVICTHLNLFVTGQRLQSKKIIEVTKSSNPKTIVGGDFNDWSGLVGKSISAHTDLKEVPLQRSYPSIFPVLKLDRMFHRGFKMIESKTILEYRFCSDHFPMLVTLEF